MYWGTIIEFYEYNFNLLLFILLSYVPVVFLLKSYMKYRNPLNVKNYIFVWNLSLGIFSFYCFKNITLELLNSDLFLTRKSICESGLGIINENFSRWQFYFIISKFPEMIDTVWIVVRKRPLTLLQVWHHFSVTLYCWVIVYSYYYNEGGHGGYFAAMNSFVHMIMYTYYAIVTKSKFRSNTIALFITTIQIIQMILGCMIHTYKFIYCDNKYMLELNLGFLIYGSYLYLFMDYFYKRYILS